METINKKLDKDYYPLFFRFITKIDKQDFFQQKIVINQHNSKKVLVHITPYHKPI